MNKNLHRIIFNAARGVRMVVAETAKSASKASGATPALVGATLATLAAVLASPLALAQIVADMFEKASPEQRAAILNSLTEKLGPGALAGVAGGVLAGHEGATTPAVTADKATQITPAQVRDVVTTARTADEPGVFDRVSDFYSQHPDLVKTLGAGALMIALARMKQNLGR